METALRNREMNRDEAQELLNQLRSLDWRRHEAPSGYDPTNQSSMTGAYPKFSHVAQQMSFPPVSPVNLHELKLLSCVHFYRRDFMSLSFDFG